MPSVFFFTLLLFQIKLPFFFFFPFCPREYLTCKLAGGT